MKLAICIAGLSALALFGAGCGGDDDNGALSYDDTGTEISAICSELNTLGDDLNGEPENDAPILADILVEYEAAVEEVRDMEVPEELQSAHDAFVASGEEQVALIEQAQADAEAGDKKAYLKTLNSGQELDREGNRLANELGADDCIT